jgi:hypothetical protein
MATKIEELLTQMAGNTIELQTMLKKAAADIRREAANMSRETSKMSRETSKIQQTIGGFTKSDAEAIEEESNKDIKEHLKEIFSSHAIYAVKGMKVLISHLKAEVNNRDTRTITDFDGMYVVADAEYHLSDMYGHLIQAGTERGPTRFLVLEAKHSLTVGMIDKKIQQMLRFQEYLKAAKAWDPAVHTKQFEADIEHYQLKTCSSDLRIVFVSPHFQEHCKEHIDSKHAEWRRQGLEVWFMSLAGNRYEVKWWNGTRLESKHIVASGAVKLFGGRRKKARKTARKSKRSARTSSRKLRRERFS